MPLVPLDQGILAWLDDEPGDGHPNAGVVIDADGITVVDALCVPSQYVPFAEEVTAIGMPVRRLVLTSSMLEQTGGSVAFGFAAVYGRQQTSVHLDQAPDPGVLRRLHPTVASEVDDELRTRPVSHVVREPVQLTPALTLVPSTGPQEEGLVAIVSGAGICFAGALLSFGVTPCCYQGDPARWADELDRLADVAPIFVPGRGPIGGEEELRDLQAYLRACVAAEGDPGRIGRGPWDRWVDRHHDDVNVERAAMLGRGEDAIPPTLLRRAGLA